MSQNNKSRMAPEKQLRSKCLHLMADFLWGLGLIAISLAIAQAMGMMNHWSQSVFVFLFAFLPLALLLSITLHSYWGLAAKFAVYGTACFFVGGLMNFIRPVVMYFYLSSLLITALYFSGSKATSYRRAFRWSFCVLFATVILTPASTFLFPYDSYNRLLEVREEYPIVDISSRLVKYENRAGREFPDPQPVTSAETDKELDLLETFFDSNMERRWMRELKYIHDTKFEKSARTPSLNVDAGRPSFFFIPSIEQPTRIPFQPEYDIESIPADKLESLEKERRRFFLANGDHPEFPTDENAKSRHRTAFMDFFHPTGLGYSTSFQKTVRFIPHGFHYPVEPLLLDGVEFRLERLELVGWIDGNQPCAYVLDHMPLMQEINKTDVQTRPLDDFETTALAQLNEGEMIVVDKNADEMRMLGAIRATDNCLDCHDVQRGEMLGAFTYFWEK